MTQLLHYFVWLAEDIKLRDKEATHTVDVPDTNSTSREVKEMMDDADTVKGGVETVKESREVKPTRSVSFRFLRVRVGGCGWVGVYVCARACVCVCVRVRLCACVRACV